MCGATGYRLDVSTSSSFSSYVTGYHNLNVGTALNRSVTSLNASTTYYYRVRAYNGNGASGNSNVVHVTTLGLPTPTPTPTPAGIPSIIISSVVSTITGHNQYWTDYSVAVYGRTTGTPYYYTYEAGWGIYGTINRTLSLNPENWSFYFTYTQFPGPPSTYEIWAEEYDGSYTLVAHDSQSITFTY